MRNNIRSLFSLTRIINYERKLAVTRTQVSAVSHRFYSNTGSSQENEKAEAPPGDLEPLVDSFGRRHDYLRISLTERCNLRCFNDDEIGSFVELTRSRALEVRFIEFMPFAGNKWAGERLVPYRAALRAAAAAHPGLEPAPPRPNDTATVWRVPGYVGSVGFIHSMTQPFCSTCNRLRLTADGNLKVCLLGAAEVSLRDALRAGAPDRELDTLVRTALGNKRARHAARARLGARAYCTRAGPFTHLDGEGRARMVDVGDKEPTRRVAVAACELHVSARLLRLLRDARLPKGDALTVAQVAGALGAKRTSDLLPMCHALALDAVRVRVTLPRGDCPGGGAVLLQCEVRARAPTGVEMEALTGVAVAALALYDMCKSVDRAMRIGDLRLLHKSGGRSDVNEPPPPPPVRPLGAEPRTPRDTEGETYAPTDVAHF